MQDHIEPCVFVLFGVTGDLAQKKLIPALAHLCEHGDLRSQSIIIGVGRKQLSDEEFKTLVQNSLDVHEDIHNSHILDNQLQYLQGNLDDDSTYRSLKIHIDSHCQTRGLLPKRIVYYFAIPPTLFGTVTEHLVRNDLTPQKEGSSWPRLIFEKPFGADLHSARLLNEAINQGFREQHIYRIDHYLAKTMVHAITTLRFGNSILERLLDRSAVDHIQVTIAENIGAQGRATYYDHTGALRDMIQNHALQTLSLLLMQPPTSLSAQHIHDEKAKVLSTIKLKGDSTNAGVRGQYTEANGMLGYVQEEKIVDGSNTETFAAIKINAYTWRWESIPIYIRSGKRMPEKRSEIHVVFTQAPQSLFGEALDPNRLTIRIQPKGGIDLMLYTSSPTQGESPRPISLSFCQECDAGDNIPESYEKLLRDVLLADHTLFTRWDEVEASWEIIQPLIDAWKQGMPHPYPAGTWGPQAANDLIEKDNRAWINGGMQ